MLAHIASEENDVVFDLFMALDQPVLPRLI